jgi:hypothetical protein
MRPYYLRNLDYWGEGTELVGDGWSEDYQEITYQFSNSGTYEVKEVIRPKYTVGDWIIAANTVYESLLDEDNKAMQWTDLNVDGRSWQVDLRSFAVCVDINGTDTQSTSLIAGTKSVAEVGANL